MKCKKKIAGFLISAAMLVSLGLGGCASKNMVPADQTVSALMEFVLKEDAAPMQELFGFATEEDVWNSIVEGGAENQLVDSFQKEFTSQGIELTEEGTQKIYDSVLTMLDKIQYTAEITEKGRDTTTVTVKMNGFSQDEVAQLATDFQTQLVTNMENMTQEELLALSSDQEALNDLMLTFIIDYMTALSELEPGSEQTEITVVCEKMLMDVSGKNVKVWFPSDVNQFSADIEAAMIQ